MASALSAIFTVFPNPQPDSGASAGELIFRSRILQGLWAAFLNTLFILLLMLTWTFWTSFGLFVSYWILRSLGAGLQVAVLLSRPGTDFQGGEFVLTEQRPRRQSRAEVVPLSQGDAVVFPVRERPVRGARGVYRATMRHGVSRVRSGERFTLGIICHDAA